MPRPPNRRPALAAPARPAKPVPQPGPGIPRIDTERFYLRTLKPSDVTPSWLAWLADPEVMEPVNSRPRDVGAQQVRNYVAGVDQRTRLLIGIFDKIKLIHIGLYDIKIEMAHRLATFNVIVGDKSYWGDRVVLETRAALLDHLFDQMNIEKAIGMPPARNFPSVFNYRAQGWRLEGVLKGHRLSMDGGRIDQLQFGLLKEEWHELRRK